MRARLWRCGLGLALFITTLTVGNSFVSPDKQLNLKSAGHDFLAFYTAGTFLREGRSADLYDLNAVRTFQHELASQQDIQLGEAFAPWWNPPFYAWVFVPLSLLTYSSAWLIWMCVNILSAALACVLVTRMLPGDCDWKCWGLVPVLIGTSLPFIQSLGHGQNSSTSLLLVALVVTLWRQRRALAAGLVLGLLFYKPQLAAVLSIVLVLTLGRKALLGILMTGMMLLGVTLTALPGTLGEFLARVPGNLHHMQVERAYVWDRHITFTAFWRYLLQGDATGETAVLATVLGTSLMILLAGALLRAIWKRRHSASHDAIIAATIVATPLLMPFYFDYDLLLLAVPAALFAGERLRTTGVDHAPLQRLRTIGWVVLFAWLFVNPFVTSLTRVNGSVLLVFGLATTSIIAALRPKRETALPQPQTAATPQSLPIAA